MAADVILEMLAGLPKPIPPAVEVFSGYRIFVRDQLRPLLEQYRTKLVGYGHHVYIDDDSPMGSAVTFWYQFQGSRHWWDFAVYADEKRIHFAAENYFASATLIDADQLTSWIEYALGYSIGFYRAASGG